MDLGAYANIDNIEKIAELNNIEVPRLRGYRLMKDEKPLDLEEFCENLEVNVVQNLCTSIPFWNPHAMCSELSDYTDWLQNKYLIKEKHKEGQIIPHYIGIRWNKIHGWKRKVLKTTIHNERRRYKKQVDTFNKYIGRDDILYIHARIGGGNWPYYYKEVINKPWFIEKVDDSFDSTYCDIYAKISTNIERR